MIKLLNQFNKYLLHKKVHFLMRTKENYQTHRNICLMQKRKVTVILHAANRIQVKLLTTNFKTKKRVNTWRPYQFSLRSLLKVKTQ